MSINAYMTEHHRHCDEPFATAEEAVADGRWADARTAFAQFCEEMAQHFAMEETVLFPAYEAQTGMDGGPTAVMRSEHEEIRRLMTQLEMALQGEDGESYLGTAETLMIMIQQHNMKEEQMLYPMAERVLGGDAEGVLTEMKAIPAG
jgi:hemerythrin-like domain-containing protein